MDAFTANAEVCAQKLREFATSAYIDDILINENQVPVLRVQHFLDHGLVSNDRCD